MENYLQILAIIMDRVKLKQLTPEEGLFQLAKYYENLVAGKR